MDPNDLRDRVEKAIMAEIEPKAWKRCAMVPRSRAKSLQSVLNRWRGQ